MNFVQNKDPLGMDPIPPLDRALAGAIRLYDLTRSEPELKVQVLFLLAHIRAAQKAVG